MVLLKCTISDMIDLGRVPSEIDARILDVGKEVGVNIVEHTDPYVPIDTGALRDSPFRRGVKMVQKGDMFTETITYSSSKSGFDYAFVQHEFDYFHPKGGQMHYATLGMEDAKDDVAQIFYREIGAAIDSSISKGSFTYGGRS